MSLLSFCARIFVDWCVVSCIAVGAYGIAMSRMKHRRRPKPPVEHINWMTHLPPVPPPVVPAPDAEWLSIWPNAVDDDALCDAEFVSLINSNFFWPWPDSEDAA